MLASACGASSSNPATSSVQLEKPNLVVGAVPAETSTALYIAEQEGIFAQHGLNVTIKKIITTNDVVPDLLNGQLDIASGQVTSFISAQANGQGPFRVLASGLAMGPHVDEMVALPSSGISTPAELKGRTIGENAPAGNGVLLTDALLSDYGVRPDQVNLKTIPFARMAAAMLSHQADAFYCTEPYCSLLEQDGAAAVADLDQGSAENLLIGGYSVTAAWLAKYPHTAAAFAAAIDQASQIADANLAADEHAFETYVGVSAGVADVMADGTFPSSVSATQLQQVENLMLEFNELKKQVDVAAMVFNNT